MVSTIQGHDSGASVLMGAFAPLHLESGVDVIGEAALRQLWRRGGRKGLDFRQS